MNYLKVDRSKWNKDYDTYYHIIKPSKTWSETLECVERELEAHYYDNDDSMVGVKFTIEIVNKIPPEVEMDENY